MKKILIFLFFVSRVLNCPALSVDHGVTKLEDSTITYCPSFDSCLVNECNDYFELENCRGKLKQGVFLKLAILSVRADKIYFRLTMVEQFRLDIKSLLEFPYFLKLGSSKFINPILLVCSQEEKEALGRILEKVEIVKNKKKCAKKILKKSNHESYTDISNRSCFTTIILLII